MTYDDVRKALGSALKRAGITKRIYPHLFRHTRASLLASKVAEAPLESQMGWVPGTKQMATYVHLSGKQTDAAILKAYGVEVKDDGAGESMPVRCPRCEAMNPSNANYCRKCWLPLNVEEALKQSQRLDKIESALQILSIDERDKERLETFGPEAKMELLTSLLIDMEKTGQLDQLKKVISAMGNNKNQ